MAELSLEEGRRLARQFLTGSASPAEVERLAAFLPEDQTLALELFAQMQAALDDVAPSALTAEQDRSVDARIEALIVPRIRRRGPFGWLGKLFRRSPKPAAPARRRGLAARVAPPVPPPAPVELPPPSLPAEGGLMEEVAPIVATPEAPPSAPAAEQPRGEAEPFQAAVPPLPPAKKWGSPRIWSLLGGALLLLLLAGAWGLRLWWQQRAAGRAAGQAPPPPAPRPTPPPTPGPAPSPAPLRPLREPAVAGDPGAPLPAELPPTTPQPAGLLPGLGE